MQRITGFLDFLGQDPFGSGKVQIKVSTSQVDYLNRLAPESYWNNFLSAIDVVKEPEAIHIGLSRQGHEGSFGYVGRPRRRFSDGKSTGPPMPGGVFLACVSSNFVLFEFRWERQDASNAGVLIGTETRFSKLIWNRS